MATGNKIVYLLDHQYSDKLYPFDQNLKCLLPLGSTTLLEWNLACLKDYFTDEIIVLGPDHPIIRKVCEDYQVSFQVMQENFINQIYQLSLLASQLLIMDGNIVLSNICTEKLKLHFQQNKNIIYTADFDDMSNSSMEIGIQSDGNQVVEIYGHARPHYVDCYAIGIYQCTSDFLKAFAYIDKGFESVNCGQMPPNTYILENALQVSLQKGFDVFTEKVVRHKEFSILKYSWDIVASNQFVTKQLIPKGKEIHESAYVSNDIELPNNIRIGKHTTIERGVIFEGDCWIGDHVTIKNGAIIGHNTLINDHATIKDYCRVNDDTVIGHHCKIGYLAEISGVLFDGVSAVHACEVYGVIGRKVDIAAGVQTAILRFDDAPILQNINGKKYSNHFTSYICIGDYTRTGVNNIFAPGVRVGSQCAISPGVIVDKNIEHNTLIRLTQEYRKDHWGSHRYGW